MSNVEPSKSKMGRDLRYRSHKRECRSEIHGDISFQPRGRKRSADRIKSHVGSEAMIASVDDKNMNRKNNVDEKKLSEIIRRIVKVAAPERIIVFGSAVRGEMGPNSDVDLLVVKGGKYNRSRLAGEIYMNLHGVGQAVDVILVTPEDIERYRDTHCLIIKPALREGKEVYRA